MYAYVVAFHGASPCISTIPTLQKKIIELLKADFETRKLNTYTVVDLGSGNGQLTRALAKALPQAKIIGIELAWQSVQWANWRKQKAGLTNLEYKRMNLFKYDFSQADAFVIFQIPELLQDIGRKLHQEAKPDAFIITNKYELRDGWQPDSSMNVKTRHIHQGLMHIYRRRPA
jgi:2-polyprenyl-3-methyl-5-hydroxy-6-metoxy-1,4-benzoquinol methylase